jgi:hypothetical protein
MLPSCLQPQVPAARLRLVETHSCCVLTTDSVQSALVAAKHAFARAPGLRVIRLEDDDERCFATVAGAPFRLLQVTWRAGSDHRAETRLRECEHVVLFARSTERVLSRVAHAARVLHCDCAPRPQTRKYYASCVLSDETLYRRVAHLLLHACSSERGVTTAMPAVERLYVGFCMEVGLIVAPYTASLWRERNDLHVSPVRLREANDSALTCTLRRTTELN